MMTPAKHGARIICTVAAVLAILVAGLLTTGCASEQEQLDAAKERVAQLLAQHGQLRDFLENTLYEFGGDVFITNYPVEDQAPVIVRNGKLVTPAGYNDDWYKEVQRYEATIIELFDTFHCDNISLFQSPYGPGGRGKYIRIVFNNLKIDDHWYLEKVTFSRDGDGPVEDAGGIYSGPVFKNWYYYAPAYT
jgi:hypothetical protein